VWREAFKGIAHAACAQNVRQEIPVSSGAYYGGYNRLVSFVMPELRDMRQRNVGDGSVGQ
jgi:hypothetical protein